MQTNKFKKGNYSNFYQTTIFIDMVEKWIKKMLVVRARSSKINLDNQSGNSSLEMCILMMHNIREILV